MNKENARHALLTAAKAVPDQLVDFGRALESADTGPAVDGWPYFLARADKWTDEYVTWCDFERPQESGPNWPAFRESIEALDHA